ncbi:unnamed protein product [Paramecium sonneborni]|uniref:Uncharacterized protein n=1 Tax=Paramecium sonneborni TaxID=65129 RepID=A0A8S1MD08_9CILI|nr:unnamed protein product [Paramecium sonneborni]
MWNNTSCQNRNCSNIHYKSQCLEDYGCFYNSISRNCQYLTDCNQLNATSTLECASQSKFCGLFNTSSKQCYHLTIASCTSYTVQQECLYFAQGQLCKWNNQQCQDFNCNSVENQSQCDLYALYCTWDIKNQICIQATCDNKHTSECTFIFSKDINQNQSIIQPCYIDQSDRPAQCKNASLSDLSPLTCSLNTFSYAKWNDESLESGSCQFCQANLINIIGLALLIMIQ